MSTVTSLGVGSGLDLESLVTQLVSASYDSKFQTISDKQDAITVQLSAVSQVKSALETFQDSLAKLKSADSLSERQTTVTNPDDIEAFTAEATSSASVGNYKIEVLGLAKGSVATTQDGTFSSSSDVVSTTDGVMTFSAGDETFDVNVTAGMTVSQLRDAINKSASNFGVNANIINTGDSTVGTKLVFTSSVTGDPLTNNLTITNNNSELDKVSTVASGGGSTMSLKDSQQAHITIDGVDAYSDSNTMENVIANVTLELNDVTDTDSPSTLKVGTDSDDIEQYIRDFVDSYNSMMSTLKDQTSSGTFSSSGTALTDGGALQGDATLRGFMNQMASLVSNVVQGASPQLNTLYALGISMNSDGELEIETSNSYGGESGEDRLSSALEDNFDDIAALFSGDNGIATQMDSLLEQYTQRGGLLDQKTDTYNDQLDDLNKQETDLSDRQTSYESTLRSRYTALDTALAEMNSSSSYVLNLLASL
ncbi:flagellar filament capping protein FliD [Pokkaliibacter sp. CJK22405]|uniref:flagellar filament capping protein FliD n=1 Tax=Pokkaliibacter sp. CJK22405 TaxID=3384615 RepID=UPI003984629A